MALTPAEITALNNEITTDPLAIGYNVGSGDNYAVVDLLNAADPQGGTIQRDVIAVNDLHLALDAAELSALPLDKKVEWQTLLLAISDFGAEKNMGNIVSLIKNCFPVGTTSWGNIVALQNKAASRGEAIIGREYVFTIQDIREILNG